MHKNGSADVTSIDKRNTIHIERYDFRENFTRNWISFLSLARKWNFSYYEIAENWNRT